LIDPRTGLIDRAWYLFFLSLNDIATNVVDDTVLGPSSESLIASYDAALQALAQEVETQSPPVDLSAELIKQIEAAGLVDCCSGLLSQVAEMQKQIQALNLLPPPAQGTVTAVTATSPVVSSGGTAPDISMPAANTTTDGYLTSTDWNTFNSKAPATSGTSILYGNGSGGFSNVTIGSGVSFAGGTLSATGSGGTVTSVTGTSPIASSGGTTPAISISQASTSTNGYLSSTDWNTFNNKGSGTVTSVTGTAPVVSSGGTTPAISMAAASTSTNGYLTSTDWNTFNGKQAAGTYVTAITIASSNGFAGTSSGGATPALTLTTSITGLLKGNGTAISAAVANTDYVPLSTVLTKTADYTITGTDTWIINNKTGSALTLTFPAASSWTGRSITVKNMQAQLVNSATSNIVPIDSTTAGTAILLAVVGNWATMVSDGTNWVIMQQAANNNLLLE
jgi:hypothetical protein